MSHPVPNILIVESDPESATQLCRQLTDHFQQDCNTVVHQISEALALDLQFYDLVLCDLDLPDGSGLELIDQLLARREDIPIIIVTDQSDLNSTTHAIQRGAYDYVVKIGDYLQTIPLVVEKNMAVYEIKQNNRELQNELKSTLKKLKSKNKALHNAVEQLEKLALTDPLTGLANRRHIQMMLENYYAEALRYDKDMACIMIDLDGFKGFNDTLGHIEGDELLRVMSRVLCANCRKSDLAGRYGGDEFVILLPHAQADRCEQIALRIQQQFLREMDRLFASHPPCNTSIGIAVVSLSKPKEADQLVAMADEALYKAKAMGKAQIFLHHNMSA